MPSENLNIAITGAGGSGAVSCGQTLLRSWAAAGGRGVLRKAFGPQIRGGEAAALLTLGADERYAPETRCDVLLALDWAGFDRFEDEIRLHGESLVLAPSGEDVPERVLRSGASVDTHDLASIAQASHADGRANTVALGLLGAALDLPLDRLQTETARRLADKPEAYRSAARACVEAGFSAPAPNLRRVPPRPGGRTWCLSGNEAAACGALLGGVRLVAAYPITPASDVLEWLAGALPRVGGHLIQAEDELAAISMVIGAAHGGVPAFTATSGPGLALMVESLGLAVASETPVCVLDVMRGGPSTGLPTRSEQGDLDLALHGLHGDAPHLVLAPLDIADCVAVTARAVRLAQQLQTVAIVLSDQRLGHSTAIVTPPEVHPEAAVEAAGPQSWPDDYRRYEDTPSGLSPRALPGDAGGRYTADGLEHDARGTPSSRASTHHAQLDKRLRKLNCPELDEDWARVAGSGDVALVGFGSTAAALTGAAERLQASGVSTRTIALRLLSPLPVERLMAALEGCTRAIVVEQNHSAQLLAYLRGQLPGDLTFERLATAGPIPIDADAITARVLEGARA